MRACYENDVIHVIHWNWGQHIFRQTHFGANFSTLVARRISSWESPCLQLEMAQATTSTTVKGADANCWASFHRNIPSKKAKCRIVPFSSIFQDPLCGDIFRMFLGLRPCHIEPSLRWPWCCSSRRQWSWPKHPGMCSTQHLAGHHLCIKSRWWYESGFYIL
jgi:hypothetical protein